MRRGTYVLVAVLIATSITATAFAVFLQMHREHGNRHPGLSVVLELEHYRDGKLIERVVKEGDLIVENFARWLTKMFAGYNDPDGDDNIVNMGGGTYRGYVSEIGRYPGKIRLGTSTKPPGLSDYKLGNETVSFNIQDCDILYNGNDMIVDCFGSYTFDSNMDLREIGISFYVSGGWILVAHDVLSNPIAVSAGDAIVVHYKFVIDNP